MQAVINISSEETRLRPISCIKPVAGVKMGDKTLVEHLVKNLKHHFVTEIVIIAGCMEDKIKDVLKEEYDGLKIKYVNSDLKDGGLKAAKRLLREEFLYFSHLVYTDADFSALIDFHRKKNAYATIAVGDCAGGRLLTGADYKVNRIEEKRLWNSITGDEKGTGIYVLKKDIIKFIPEEMSTDLFESIFPALVRAGKNIYALPIGGKTVALEDISGFLRAGILFAESLKKDGKKGIVIEEGALVEKGALLEEPCYIAQNAHIYPRAKIGAYSIIGEGSVVKDGASLKRSIVLKGCRIGKNTSLRGCIADDAVSIGDESNVLEQAVLGKGCKIGNGVTVKSFVKIWPEKTIEDGTCVSENVLWGQKTRIHLYKKGVIEGVVNSDITPRFCTKLGECVGAVFDGGEVGIATDETASGVMIKEAVSAGLTGMGCAVKDFGEQPVPITRRGVLFYMLKGAVSIEVHEKDGEEVANINIIGYDGLDIDEKMRLKMEDYFERAEFLYPESKNIKEREYLFEYKIHYLKSLVKKDSNSGKQMKILLACPARWGRRLISSAMADYNNAVSMYMPYCVETEREMNAFEQSVEMGGFDIGFVTDASCEKVTIVPRGKRRIDDDTYTVLTSLIMMKKNPKSTIHVPLATSSAVDALAEKYNCKIVRSMFVPDDKIKGSESVPDEYIFRFDAVGSIIKTVEFLANEDIDNLLSEIPKITMAKTVLEIPKGDEHIVLNRLKNLGENIESDEGVKIVLDKGWVVVMRESGGDVCRVVGEGASYETAKELCDFCIEEMLKK